MPDVALTSKNLTRERVDALVVLVTQSEPHAVVPSTSGLDAKLVKGINAQLEAHKVSGKADEIHRLIVPGFDGIVITVGAGGDEADLLTNPDLTRAAAGAATRALTGVKKAGFDLSLGNVDVLRAAVEGVVLGGYSYGVYKTKPTSTLESAVIYYPGARKKEAQTALTEAIAVADAQNWARDLVNMPPLDLYPDSFAQIVSKRLAGKKVKVDIKNDDQLRAEGCGGLIGVGRGSARPPRLVTLSYTPRKAQRHIAIVGKGVTFDSGGLCLKPANSMSTMKCDMAGAAAVAAYVEAAAALDLPVAITGYLCLAENLTGADAQRPGDVITMRNGKTVEIDNTDAEGRLVMADGLSYASQEQPDLIIDIATLTGAAVLALGNRTAAVVGNNDIVRDEAIAASGRVGEAMWPMPLLDHIRPSLESDVADLKHTGERMGGLITAALFLQEFIGDDKQGRQTDWLHFDIAAPAFNESSAYGFTPKGGTGFAVRTLVEMSRTK